MHVEHSETVDAEPINIQEMLIKCKNNKHYSITFAMTLDN